MSVNGGVKTSHWGGPLVARLWLGAKGPTLLYRITGDRERCFWFDEVPLLWWCYQLAKHAYRGDLSKSRSNDPPYDDIISTVRGVSAILMK
jgi:hypothetical protein